MASLKFRGSRLSKEQAEGPSQSERMIDENPSPEEENHHAQPQQPQPLHRAGKLIQNLIVSLVFICFSLLLLAFSGFVGMKADQIADPAEWNTIHEISVKASKVLFSSVISIASEVPHDSSYENIAGYHLPDHVRRRLWLDD